MTVSVEQFVKAVSESGLIASDELNAFQAGLPDERRPKDAQALARELISAGKLTKYQASAAYQGKAKSLLLGQYMVLDKIGAGGMGQVYKAQHRRMKRVVAIKVLPAAATKSPDSVKRFQREVEAAARLSHPNIVIAHDADEANGTHFLVMEYVEGSDLSAIDKLGRTLAPGEAIDYMIQAARGLAYAHSQGVIHRDIKPANLLLDKHGQIKILDMGLARIEAELGAADGLTRSGDVMGTVDYMPPEQAEDTRRADQRSDIYSLGCTLYKILTGRPTYGGESIMSKMLAHRDQPIPSLCAARGDVSPELDTVFQRMVAKRPDDRYASMNDVMEALERCKAGVAAGNSQFVSGESFGPLPSDHFANLTQMELTPAPNTVGGGVTFSPVSTPPVYGPSTVRPPLPGMRSKARPANQQTVMLLGMAGGVAAVVLVLGLVLVFAFGLGAKPAKNIAKKGDGKVSGDGKKQTETKPVAPKTEALKPSVVPGATSQKPVVPGGPAKASDPDAPGNFEWLFNGSTFDGWQGVGVAADRWQVGGGTLSSRAGARTGSLFTTQEYSDFDLDLEFSLRPGGNSGVYLRAPVQDDASRTGLEIQLLDDAAPQYAGLKPEQYSGSIFMLVAAAPRASRKPGEWQTLRVHCAGSHVRVRLNGALVVDTDLNKLSDKVATFPGLTRRSGHIGLQHHGDAVDFRNIRVRNLAK